MVSSCHANELHVKYNTDEYTYMELYIYRLICKSLNLQKVIKEAFSKNVSALGEESHDVPEDFDHSVPMDLDLEEQLQNDSKKR